MDVTNIYEIQRMLCMEMCGKHLKYYEYFRKNSVHV